MWYTIKSGDSLSKLAGQYLGNMMSYMLIYEANKDILSSPDNIQVGAKIWIPKGGAQKPIIDTSSVFTPTSATATSSGLKPPKLSGNHIAMGVGVVMLLIAGSMLAKRLRTA